MHNDYSISFGLLLSIEPLDINKLLLIEEEGSEMLDWQADNTDHSRPSFLSRVISFFKI
jgi:hypothetical protein